MKKSLLSPFRHDMLRFIFPVMLENLITNVISLLFSSVIGGISASSLTTYSQGLQVLNMINATSSLFTIGGGVICSRLWGEGKKQESAEIVEQTLSMAVTFSAAISITALFLAPSLVRLLIPVENANIQSEGITYFRLLFLSFPFLLISGVSTSLLRAAGDGKASMFVGIVSNVIQIASAYLLVKIFHLDVLGAGLAYLFCRIAGCAVSLALLFDSRADRYPVRLSRLFCFHWPLCRRILVLGIPSAIQGVFVQAGYVISNSLVISVGTFEAAVYNVAYTVYTFLCLPQTVCQLITLPIVGQLIGAKQYQSIKPTTRKIWLVGLIVIEFFSAAVALLGTGMTGILTGDAAVQKNSADLLWLIVFVNIPALSINVLEQELNAGGDVRFVMTVCIVAVWVIRLPLTYLLCTVLKCGANGAFLANGISLLFRALSYFFRVRKGKFMTMRV